MIEMDRYRQYHGRHLIYIIEMLGKKSYIEHLACGKVGNMDCGYKEVNPGDRDIVLTRECYHIKRG